MPRRRPFTHPEPIPLRKMLNALGALVVVVLGGTVGFVFIEDLPAWRAFYFTMITITTVGYGDLGISEAGQQFTSVLLVGGIGVASYGVATIVEGVMSIQLSYNRERWMRQKIESLSEHTIVCGYGAMGRSVVRELHQDKVVVVTDVEADLTAARDAGLLVVEGPPTEDDSLKAAGVARATNLVATEEDARDNMVVTLTARQLGPGLSIVARAGRDEDIPKLRRAGADRVVCPHQSFGSDVAQAILHPRIAEYLASSTREGALALAEIAVAVDSQLEGVQLADYGRGAGDRLSFVGLQRVGKPLKMPPSGQDVLQGGDVLIVAGDPEQIVQMSQLAALARSGRHLWAG